HIRRHGPLRQAGDQPGLVLRRLPGVDAQLHRPGVTDPRPAGGRLQTVLPPPARLVARADDRPGDMRDADRVAGGYLRRLLGHPAGRAAWLSAPDDDQTHLGGDDRAGLSASRELDAFRAGRWAMSRFRLLGEAG